MRELSLSLSFLKRFGRYFENGYLKPEQQRLLPSSAYQSVPPLNERNPIEEMKEAASSRKFRFDFPGILEYFEKLEENQQEVLEAEIKAPLPELPRTISKSSSIDDEIEKELNQLNLDGVDLSGTNSDDDLLLNDTE